MSLTVLVADDDLGVRVALSDYLELLGYIVVSARDGKEALAMVSQCQPHLIVADISMPLMDGYTLIQQVRRQPAFRLVPVIFLTERTATEDRVRGYQSGCDVYLPKPFELNELGAVVRNLLERSQLIESEWRLRMQAAKPSAIAPPPALTDLTNDSNPVASPGSSNGETAPEEGAIALVLTAREQDVLDLLAAGLSNNQIGQHLHLSPRTIEKYVSNLLRKSDTANRAELVRFALDHHLVR
ncbi:MAG: response regulator transcription factor [Synechococcales bacterium]|nr:response regulator transcription factor [Synechococcales bacterium]